MPDYGNPENPQMPYAPRRHPSMRHPVPYIPPPPAKDGDVREILTLPSNVQAPPDKTHIIHPHHEGEMKKIHAQPVRVPHYNEIYDTLRTTKGWRYIADFFADGSFVPTAGAQVSVAVTLPNIPQLRLEQWPGAVSAYWVIHFFACAPQTSPATNGALEVAFSDKTGTAPLGVFIASTGGSSSADIIMPNPITDPDSSMIGTLLVTLQPGGASPVTYTWQMGIGVAYLLPTSEPWQHEMGDMHEHINSHHH